MAKITEMNAYDFDYTIYDGDSSIDFWIFCLRKHPAIFKYFPYQICGMVLYFFKRIDKDRFKELYFSFLKGLPDAENDIKSFWKNNKKKIKSWYLEQKQANDLIISASPKFLLEEICKYLNLSNLIATEVDITSGKFKSPNCCGDEKVRRFKEVFGETEIKNFYSDSLSDLPMAKKACTAFLVKGNSITKWEIKG